MTLQQLFENQKEIVYVADDQAFTDSRIIAEVFQKGHDKVLRDIRVLKCSEGFRLANFGESDYMNAQGRVMPMYILTFDGFVMLAMGYTGEKAMQFKELYIAEFNRTHQLLTNRQSTLLAAEQNLVSLAVKSRITSLYPHLTNQARRKYYMSLYKELRDKFAVLSYKDIPRSALDEAFDIIAQWDSPKLARRLKTQEGQDVE